MLVEAWILKAIPNKAFNGNEHVTGNWGKGDSYYKESENLAELCSSVLWKGKTYK